MSQSEGSKWGSMQVGLEIRSETVLTVFFPSKRGDQFADAPAWHQQIDVLAGLERRRLIVRAMSHRRVPRSDIRVGSRTSRTDR